MAKNPLPISPLAPAAFATLPPVAGVRLAAANVGLKYPEKPEVLLVELAEGTTAAGVLTRSLTASAPVLQCREHLKRGEARALVVNSGNSNAFTGKRGEESLARVQDTACKITGAKPHQFYMASTGVIGEPLKDEKITAALPTIAAKLSADSWEDAARAIMTTDTFPKLATRKVGDVTINGIAKGSGMIAPDMATMLGFIFTDATVPAAELQRMLTRANEKSFNCITVDGDTSTSDTCLLFATGKKPLPAGFENALTSLMIELAQLIVKDGEGARKFISVKVTGAKHAEAAKKIALTIANSPLVKTAIAGEDANWGRIVAAVGRAGERAERDKLIVKIGGVVVAREGAIAPDYREESIMPHMKGQNIALEIDVGVGKGSAEVWTCDLTHGYIDINGSYRS